MSRAQWTNLEASAAQRLEVTADVCVIGAGAAGIYLATELASRGLSVVLLEAGPAVCVDSNTIGFDAMFEAAHYPGATEGRYFGMGGSTSRWGGALVPHSLVDLRDESAFPDIWSHIVRVVDERGNAILKRLGYSKCSAFDCSEERFPGKINRNLKQSGIFVQMGLHLPFPRRNFAWLLEDVRAEKQPSIFYNAVAKDWCVVGGDDAGDSRVVSVVAVSRNRNELLVRAGKFIIAAGAIESARILLEIDESEGQIIVRRGAAIGCYLSDHLSVTIADVAPENRRGIAKLFAPRFEGAWMRGFRLLEGQALGAAPRAFAHFIFENVNPGFRLAKEILGALQGRRTPSISVKAFLAGLRDLTRIAYARYVRSTLYITPGTPVHLQLDIEQCASRENRVSLSAENDIYGRRIPGIYWAVTESDMVRIEETANRFLHNWSKSGLPKLQPRRLGGDGSKPYDAYHPVGTCRMGEDAEAVVDRDLKVWGVRNLWVASTGVLPSAGNANPTFTLLCLAHHLAGHLEAAIIREKAGF